MSTGDWWLDKAIEEGSVRRISKDLRIEPCEFGCTVCEGGGHHWIEGFVDGYEDPVLECKHCPTRVLMPADWPEAYS